LEEAMSTESPQAVRLIFEYEGDEVRLVSQQPVDMAVVSPSPGKGEQVGNYLETRDAAGTRIARIPVLGAFQDSAEVFPENPGDPITRVDVEPKGAFTVVVPASEAVENVVLLRVSPPRQMLGIDGNKIQELGAFRLERPQGRQQ
jgi:hypothetical protein